MTDHLSMLKASSNDVLHYGVKGMKWGVRNDRGHEGERTKTKKIAKLDAKFEKNISAINRGRGGNPELHNAIVSRMNSRVQALNDSPEFRDMDRATPELRAEYDKAASEAVVSSFEDGVREIYGSNASGTKKGVYNRDTDQIDIVDRGIQHSDEYTVPDFVVKLTRDEKGFITDTELVEASVPELKHYGVKGMKWGVTTADRTVAAQKAAAGSVIPKPAAGETETSSGRYARLESMAKAGLTNEFEDADLKFFNERTAAIAKVNKLYDAEPSWLDAAMAKTVQDTGQREMKYVAGTLAREYIGKRIVKSVTG